MNAIDATLDEWRRKFNADLMRLAQSAWDQASATETMSRTEHARVLLADELRAWLATDNSTFPNSDAVATIPWLEVAKAWLSRIADAH